ncbi:hypothetical protein ACJJTC_007435 [Scirpophaga incertulas]
MYGRGNTDGWSSGQYCMPAGGAPLSPREQLLTRDELSRLLRVFAALGVTRVRLTGGEPTLRADLEDIIRQCTVISQLWLVNGLRHYESPPSKLVPTHHPNPPSVQRSCPTSNYISSDNKRFYTTSKLPLPQWRSSGTHQTAPDIQLDFKLYGIANWHDLSYSIRLFISYTNIEQRAVPTGSVGYGGRPTVFRCAEEAASLGLEVGMTTNGVALTRRLPALRRAGLAALNVSLDSLQAARYERMARRPALPRVLAGIDLALQLGYSPVKVNVVLMKGFNDDEIFDFVEMTRDRDIEVRFIEFMPFAGNAWEGDKLVPYRAVLRQLATRYELRPLAAAPAATALRWAAHGHRGALGFIASMTRPFCAGCNRLRLTADGNLKVTGAPSDDLGLTIAGSLLTCNCSHINRCACSARRRCRCGTRAWSNSYARGSPTRSRSMPVWKIWRAWKIDPWCLLGDSARVLHARGERGRRARPRPTGAGGTGVRYISHGQT